MILQVLVVPLSLGARELLVFIWWAVKEFVRIFSVPFFKLYLIIRLIFYIYRAGNSCQWSHSWCWCYYYPNHYDALYTKDVAMDKLAHKLTYSEFWGLGFVGMSSNVPLALFGYCIRFLGDDPQSFLVIMKVRKINDKICQFVRFRCSFYVLFMHYF